MISALQLNLAVFITPCRDRPGASRVELSDLKLAKVLHVRDAPTSTAVDVARELIRDHVAEVLELWRPPALSAPHPPSSPRS